MSQLDLIFLRFKIKVLRHLLPLSLLVVFAVVTLSVLVFESRLSESVMTDVKTTLKDTGEQIESQIQERLSEYRNDLRFLHATPPVSGLPRSLNNAGIDPLEQTSYSQWKKRLETIFVAFLQNNIAYQQLRIIATTEQGMELVRVDRIGGEIKVIEDRNLQSKSDRDYFASSTQLSDREIYMSSISLNREFGKIEFPYNPMLRLSLPIFDELGQRFGFLIVNIHAEPLLNSLESMVVPPSQLMLTDNEGYFLITPKDTHKFSRDLAPTKRWNTSFQTLEQLSDDFTKILDIKDQQTSYFALTQKIVVSGDIDKGYLLARLIEFQSDVNNLEMGRRTSVYTFLVAVTVILLFVLSVFNRSMKRTQQLSEAKAQSAAIVGGSHDAIIGITKEAIVTSWNRAAELLFEYSEEYAKGKTVAELGLFQNIQVLDIIDKLSQSNTQQNADVTITKDQNSVFLSLSFSAITDFASDVHGVAIIARDITNEHIAEIKIKQANADLEQKVANRTQELEKNSRFKSAFISNISHEIRTPLNGIIGTLMLVKNESLSDNQKRYLEMTEVSVNNLSALINDVLDLSKIEAGKLDVDFQAFNPIDLIQNLCCTMAIKAQEKGLEFIVDVTDLHCESLVSDAHRFSQILSNLISNAVKFTENGFVKVSASCQFCDGGQLILHCSVSDSGVGIAENNKYKLFTAFAQEYTAVASKYGGTGLGLTICQQLVSLLNGEIGFSSEKDKGSTFSFSITVPQIDCKQKPEETRLKGKSGLILVPHSEVYRSIRRMVQSCSGDVLEPKPYEQWLSSESNVSPDMLPEIKPDFIIIDQQDPQLTILDRKWSQWASDSAQTPEVFLLKKSADIKVSLNNIVAASLDKPMLLTDLLQKGFATAEGAANKKNNLHQLSKEADFKTSVENLSKITGARILVVDDNKINLEVAKGMLSSLPIEIEQAMDGQEALDILQKSIQQNRVFHCILMDCQMPVLNGYDTSRQIRKGILGEQYNTIPIIAMTANAMLGEREKCLEAGMNDYTTKPINLDLLVSKIIECILSVYQAPLQAPLNRSLQITTSEAPVNDADSQLQDESETVVTSKILEWDKQAALTRLMNNEALLSQICQIFMNSSPNKIEALGQSITEKNFEAVIKLTHSLKGSAGDLGAVYLHQLFSSMEQLAKIPEIEKLEQCYQSVLTSYASFVSILTKEQD
jgi:PAS domain S-box-containing protein